MCIQPGATRQTPFGREPQQRGREPNATILAPEPANKIRLRPARIFSRLTSCFSFSISWKHLQTELKQSASSQKPPHATSKSILNILTLQPILYRCLVAVHDFSMS
jgi:hypothetical protein